VKITHGTLDAGIEDQVPRDGSSPRKIAGHIDRICTGKRRAIRREVQGLQLERQAVGAPQYRLRAGKGHGIPRAIVRDCVEPTRISQTSRRAAEGKTTAIHKLWGLRSREDEALFLDTITPHQILRCFKLQNGLATQTTHETA
jgi:hypothetical protein